VRAPIATGYSFQSACSPTGRGAWNVPRCPQVKGTFEGNAAQQIGGLSSG
jgi:hypothetical protein